jgi:hypothetical protein
VYEATSEVTLDWLQRHRQETPPQSSPLHCVALVRLHVAVPCPLLLTHYSADLPSAQGYRPLITSLVAHGHFITLHSSCCLAHYVCVAIINIYAFSVARKLLRNTCGYSNSPLFFGLECIYEWISAGM